MTGSDHQLFVYFRSTVVVVVVDHVSASVIGVVFVNE